MHENTKFHQKYLHEGKFGEIWCLGVLVANKNNIHKWNF